jgi:hypothetical protein
MREALQRANTPTKMRVVLALPSILGSDGHHQGPDGLKHEGGSTSGHDEIVKGVAKESWLRTICVTIYGTRPWNKCSVAIGCAIQRLFLRTELLWATCCVPLALLEVSQP